MGRFWVLGINLKLIFFGADARDNDEGYAALMTQDVYGSVEKMKIDLLFWRELIFVGIKLFFCD